MKPLFLLPFIVFSFSSFAQNTFQFNTSNSVFINEFHYDNTGVDTLEGVEIVSLVDTDLSCYKLYFVNGTNGNYYASMELDSVEYSGICGLEFRYYYKPSIQNGSSSSGDGILLYNSCDSAVIQFISYEGVVIANNGPFAGDTSLDIGVSQNADAIGTSLQLQGSLDTGFVWLSSVSSFGQMNANQSFCQTKVELSSIEFDSLSCVLGENESIALQLKNISYSNSTDTAIVFFECNDTLLLSDTISQSIAKGDSLSVVFSQGLDLSQIGSYHFKAWSTEDTLVNSDTLAYSIELYDDDSIFVQLEEYIVHCHDQDTLVLDAQVNGADFYSWNTGDTTQQLFVFPSSDTAFYFYAHNLCYADTVAVEVDYVTPKITFMAINTNGGDTIYSDDGTYDGIYLIEPQTYDDVILSSIEPFEFYHFYYNSPYPDDTLINFYGSNLLVRWDELGPGSSNNYGPEIIIYLEATDSNGCFTKERVVVFWWFDGVSDAISLPLSIFPNPNDGNFTVSVSDFGDSSPIQAEVFNAFGQVVHSESFVFHSAEIQRKFKLDHLKKGLYFIRLKSKDKHARKRLIIH